MDAATSVMGPPARPKKRTGTSKYDFIKVKVWLGADRDHYYILSRFLICRMLTVTRIPYIKAVKIALETKKYLVDNNLHDVTQAQLEDVLFSIVRSKGFDEAHIDCYRMVTQFYQSRQPLCIIICGASWTGKSTLAQQLASRINIPNVMQTDVIYELLRCGPDSPLHPVPLWARPGLAGGRCCDAALVREFRREARIVREGMEGDLIKTLSDGKPIIIEGVHLDPGMYIPDFGARGLIMLPARPSASLAAAAVAAAGGGLQAAAAAGRSPGSSPLARQGRYGRSYTMPARGAAAVNVTTGVAPSAPEASQDPGQSQQQQQQDVLQRQPDDKGQEGLVQLRERFSSGSAEVSVSAAGPLSPGALNPACADAHAALQLLAQSAAGAGHGQQLSSVQDNPLQQQQQQPNRLHGGSDSGNTSQQMLPPLPPLPPLRVRKQRQQQVRTGPLTANGSATQASSPPCSSSSSTSDIPLWQTGNSCQAGSPSPVQQPVLYMPEHATPFAGAAAPSAAPITQSQAAAGAGPEGRQGLPAAAAAAARLTSAPWLPHGSADGAAAASGAGLGRVFSSPVQLPVVMFDEVQVCAAAAEAAALHQHHMELQQQLPQQQQQQLVQRSQQAPGSPFSSASDVSSLGRGGSSPPCISQEHSTTEVVSRVCSCASLGSPAYTLSKEPSTAEVGSPAATGPTAATGAAAEGSAVNSVPYSNRQLSSGSSSTGLTRSGSASLRVRSSTWSSSRRLQALPEERQQGAAGQSKQHQQQQQATLQPQQQDQQQGEAGLIVRQLPPAACEHTGFNVAHNGRQAGTETAVCTQGSVSAGAQHASPEQQQQRGCAGCEAAGQPAQAPEEPAAETDCQQLQPVAQLHQQQQQQQEQQQQVAPTPTSSAHLTEQQQQQRQAAAAQQEAVSPSAQHQAPKAPGSEAVGKPLFVPILVYMDEADHALMADEALAHLGLSAGNSSDNATAGTEGDNVAVDSCMHTLPARSGSAAAAGLDALSVDQQQRGVTVPEALRRVRLLQEYLCAYEAQGLPVVKVSYGAFGEALDKLHEYVLQCIKVAMTSPRPV